MEQIKEIIIIMKNHIIKDLIIKAMIIQDLTILEI